MNESQMKAALERRADVLMCAIAGMHFMSPVAMGLGPAQVGELAALLDAWCVGGLTNAQHVRARELADLAGVDLSEIDRIAIEQEKIHE